MRLAQSDWLLYKKSTSAHRETPWEDTAGGGGRGAPASRAEKPQKKPDLPMPRSQASTLHSMRKDISVMPQSMVSCCGCSSKLTGVLILDGVIKDGFAEIKFKRKTE